MNRVLRQRRGLHFALPAQQARRILFPVRDRSVRFSPRGGWGLYPTPLAASTLGNKLSLWNYISAAGLNQLMAQTWTSTEQVTYPAVLKPLDAEGSSGVVLCQNADELTRHLASSRYAGGHFVIQRYISGPEFTLHGVAVDGQLVWSLAYHYPDHGGGIRQPNGEQHMVHSPLSRDDLAAFNAFLKPFAYSGPVNMDFKRDADGRVAVLEVNPRFGGSLFRAGNRADLIAAIGALIANVRWLGWSPVVRLPFRTV